MSKIYTEELEKKLEILEQNLADRNSLIGTALVSMDKLLVQVVELLERIDNRLAGDL